MRERIQGSALLTKTKRSYLERARELLTNEAAELAREQEGVPNACGGDNLLQ